MCNLTLKQLVRTAINLGSGVHQKKVGAALLFLTEEKSPSQCRLGLLLALVGVIVPWRSRSAAGRRRCLGVRSWGL